MFSAKSIEQKLTAFVTLLPLSAGIAIPVNAERAVAQSVQGALGQCILDLRRANIYGPSAADRCVNQLQNSSPTQSLGQCIEDMKLANIYGPTAADRCERLLAAQQQNRGGRGNSSSSRSQRRLRVNNNFGVTLYELYLSPANDSGWGRDILGSSVLEDGYYLNFTLSSPECAYDIRAVFDDGSVIEDQFDSCRYSTYTLN